MDFNEQPESPIVMEFVLWERVNPHTNKDIISKAQETIQRGQETKKVGLAVILSMPLGRPLREGVLWRYRGEHGHRLFGMECGQLRELQRFRP